MFIRQVDEWASRGDEPAQLLENVASRGRNEAASDSGDIDQILPALIADDQRVQTVRSGEVAANDKFLAAIHPMLDPGAGALSRLVEAVSAFGHDTVEALLADHEEHVAG